MKNKKKLTMGLSLALVGVLGIGATLAYLTDETGTLTNKFTFSEKGININLDEAEVDENNKALKNGSRILEGGTQEYKNIIPNMIIDKDPTVTVNHKSLNSHVFVSVTNTNTKLTIGASDGQGNFVEGVNDLAWKEVAPSDYGLEAKENTKYYVYSGPDYAVDPETGDKFTVIGSIEFNEVKVLPDIFTHVKVADDVKEDVEFSDIVIKAAAVQADSVTDAEAAKTALEMLI